jgi:hypothetical protein
MKAAFPLLLLAGCAVLPVSPRRMGTLEERVATLEKRLDTLEQAAPAFSMGEGCTPYGGPGLWACPAVSEASAPVASVGMAVPYEAATKTLLGARNASGTMALVSGNPVVTGTTITSTWANNTLSDIATELTDSLSRSNKGAMLAPLTGYVGTVSLPGYTFSGDTNTGLYWVVADDFAAAVGGTKVQEWRTDGVTFTPGITVTQSQSNTAAGVSPATARPAASPPRGRHQRRRGYRHRGRHQWRGRFGHGRGHRQRRHIHRRRHRQRHCGHRYQHGKRRGNYRGHHRHWPSRDGRRHQQQRLQAGHWKHG